MDAARGHIAGFGGVAEAPRQLARNVSPTVGRNVSATVARNVSPTVGRNVSATVARNVSPTVAPTVARNVPLVPGELAAVSPRVAFFRL